MKNVTNREVEKLADATASRIRDTYRDFTVLGAYPVPRGGIPAAYAVAAAMVGFGAELTVVDNPAEADIIIDDLIDSGSTSERYALQYPGKGFFALLDKRSTPEFCDRDEWIVWPWEGDAEGSIDDNVVRLLQYVGEDINREGLKETPKRVAKAWKEWCSGYLVKPEDVLKSFEDGAEGVDEMVAQKNLPFYSHCEHHMAPFFGTVTIAYVPNKRIVGLSKLARLVDVFSKRLQVQERLTNQIAAALQDSLQPKGVGVLVKARHLCMESRGVARQGQETITSALRGVLLTKPEARAEFLDLAR